MLRLFIYSGECACCVRLCDSVRVRVRACVLRCSARIATSLPRALYDEGVCNSDGDDEHDDSSDDDGEDDESEERRVRVLVV